MHPKALLLLCLFFSIVQQNSFAQHSLRLNGQPAQLDIREAGEKSLRITLKPKDYPREFPEHPGVVDRPYASPVIRLQHVDGAVEQKVGSFFVRVTADPLRVEVKNAGGDHIQTLVWDEKGVLTFDLKEEQVLGMGEGGPKPAADVQWRTLPVEMDRRGRYHKMEPRWQSDAYGSRNPAAMLWGTSGWGLFVATPWVEVDLQQEDHGRFIPWIAPPEIPQPQTQRNQHDQGGKGRHPVKDVVPGLYDLFLFDAQDPSIALKDFSIITGPAVMPPKWALGYMQSHRTLEDETQMIGIVDSFRSRKIPLDAVIYLGTGFAPRGWNTKQPSFEPHPDVFKRGPAAFFNDMKARQTKVVLHMVPFDRDRLPTLQGNIPPKQGEVIDASHLLSYWKLHQPLLDLGVAAFWPDEGDWFNLFERIKRHQLYYQGALWSRPNERPWSLQRNGHPGIAQWGGWVWSGDTQSTWKTLEAQIAVGLNYSLSIGPYWGSDIGGFYVTSERTGEMYARWFQFGAFCGSFRSHTRTWHLGLPWGWGLSDMGPKEDTGDNVPSTDPSRMIDPAEMNNLLIEPIVKQYDELRYQLLPYTYTLASEARQGGLPLMRAMWIHYPKDTIAVRLADQYMWGKDLLIAPVYQKGAVQRNLYLPAGEWYDWWTLEKHSGQHVIKRQVDLQLMPIYVRAGAIIPFDPVRQYALEPTEIPTTLRIYTGADGAFELYDDDGVSQSYLEGHYQKTILLWDDQNKTLTLAPGSKDLNLFKTRKFIVHWMAEGKKKEITYQGQKMVIPLEGVDRI
jgi:alpha-glucosidase (family GH31 glycosyl hydrolase)